MVHETHTNTVKFLSGHSLQLCTQSSLCFLESNILDQSSLSITKMFLEESTEELRQICEFTCQKSLSVNLVDHLPLIETLSNREYIIIASTAPLFVKFSNGSMSHISVQTKSSGSFHVKITCAASLLQSNEDHVI